MNYMFVLQFILMAHILGFITNNIVYVQQSNPWCFSYFTLYIYSQKPKYCDMHLIYVQKLLESLYRVCQKKVQRKIKN